MSTHMIATRNSGYPGQVIIMDKDHIAMWCTLCNSRQDNVHEVRGRSGLQ